MNQKSCYDSPHFKESCGCPPNKERKDDIKIRSLNDVVNDYKKRHLENLEIYLQDLKGDICKCVYGPFNNYKKHPHQRRIPKEVLNAAINLLQGKNDEIRNAKNFSDLYAIIEGINLKGYGLLARYDFAIRYGFPRDLLPKDVYLHAGTLEGAKTVLKGRKELKSRETVSIKEFPKALQELNGLHLENLLCIYKKELKRIINKY